VAPPGRAAGAAGRAATVPRLLARTVEAVEERLAERSERAWNRAALGFLVAFAWTLAVASWLLFDLVTGELALHLDRAVGRPPRGTRSTWWRDG